jgi:acyl dehydratase
MRSLTLDELSALKGATFGPSSWLTVEQDRIDQFAEATEDRQWIHTDPKAAADGPFGTTVAHGYLTLSLIPRLMSELVTVRCGQTLNYGIEKVRFPAPVPTGSRIRLQVTVAEVASDPTGLQVEFLTAVELQGASRPVCVARVVYRFLR